MTKYRKNHPHPSITTKGDPFLQPKTPACLLIFRCRALVFIIASLGASGATRAGTLYIANFEATFESANDLPSIQLAGSYVYELLPPVSTSGSSMAVYALQSGSFTLNGQLFSANGGQIEIRNDASGAGGLLEDSVAFVGGIHQPYLLTPPTTLFGAALFFEQVAAAPSALDSLDLPTSVADLAGFGPTDERVATLAFEQMTPTGPSFFVLSAPIDFLSITEVPEPSAVALIALAFAFLRYRTRDLSTHGT